MTEIERATKTFQHEQNSLRFNNRSGRIISKVASGTKHWKSIKRQLRGWVKV